MSTFTLKAALRQIVIKNGWEEPYLESQIRSNWEIVVGENMARASRIVGLKNGELSIQTSSSTWHSEFYIRREEILSRINENFSSNVIKSLKIK
ncbi:MAG: DciA family protein [Chloroflexota bacterium]